VCRSSKGDCVAKCQQVAHNRGNSAVSFLLAAALLPPRPPGWLAARDFKALTDEYWGHDARISNLRVAARDPRL
jgi:hypothetical protein